MRDMERWLDQTLTTRTWAVMPCQSSFALGAPLYRLFRGDGQIVETAVSPLQVSPSGLEDDDWLHGFVGRPALNLLVASALQGAPQAVVDNVDAFVTHKMAAAGERITDIEAGIAHQLSGDVPAVRVGGRDHRDCVLTVRRRHGGARLVPAWMNNDVFEADATAFARACDGLQYQDFIAELEADALGLSIRGLAMLLRDPRRSIPAPAVGALVAKVTADVPDTHPLFGNVQSLLVNAGLSSRADYARYADLLTSLRQTVLVLTSRRTLVSPAEFDRLANLASWRELVESLADSFANLIGLLNGRATSFNLVMKHLRGVALDAGDDFAAAAPSDVGRVAAGLANLALTRTAIDVDARDMDERMIAYLQLIGDSGWILARPYEHGVLATMMGGW